MALALPQRDRSAVGALSTQGLVRDEIEELYDYDVVRSLPQATALIVRVAEPVIVLGSTQPRVVIKEELPFEIRRRRGGGGVVLIQPDDLWVDFWIPARDERYRRDVNEQALGAGAWWATVLRDLRKGDWRIASAEMRGEPAHRVVCFAGSGPGEVFVDEKKVVGITQWRVREGAFISCVLHRRGSHDLLNFLSSVPDGLGEAMDHHHGESLGVVGEMDDIERKLLGTSGGWQRRQLFLTPP